MMPVLNCYVDDRTMAILEREARERGRKVEELAESAIEEAALAADRDRPRPAEPQLAFESNAGGERSPTWRDYPDLGRESTIKPGYFEGDME